MAILDISACPRLGPAFLLHVSKGVESWSRNITYISGHCVRSLHLLEEKGDSATIRYGLVISLIVAYIRIL